MDRETISSGGGPFVERSGKLCSKGSTDSVCSTRVLLVGLAATEGDAVESALRRAHLEVTRARTAPELWIRTTRLGFEPPALVFIDLTLPETLEEGFFPALRRSLPSASLVAVANPLDGERAARLLALGVPSLPLPGDAHVLVELALKLASRAPVTALLEPQPRSDQDGVGALAGALDAYATRRSLSSRQRAVLRLYVAGNSDKAIAALFRCSVATVYEHWRRMARKAGVAHKADVIADFHHSLSQSVHMSRFEGQGSEFS